MKARRILIVGDSGAGKTTLAKKLSKKTGIPTYSTDDYYFKKKFSIKTPLTEGVAAIRRVYTKKTWIVEGTSKHYLSPGLAKADLIIHCKHKHLALQLLIVLQRGLRRKKERLRETLALCKYLINRHYAWGSCKYKTTISELIKPYQQKTIVLDTFKEIDAYLKKT